MSIRVLVVLAVFVLNLWAITRLLGSNAGAWRKLGWTLCIVGLPVLGVVLWLRAQSRSRSSSAALRDAPPSLDRT
jgi:hypothetical protein